MFEIPDQKVCVAFLSNHNTKDDVTLTFRGQSYFVPRHSISILADCRTVVFGTQHVNAQHNQRTFHFADQTTQNNVWQMFDEEKVPKYKQAKIRTRKAGDLYNLTKDKTDYVWYTSRCAVALLACFKASSWSVVSCMCGCSECRSMTHACLPACVCNSFKLEPDDMPIRRDIKTVLEVNSHGHASVAFVNNKFVGNTTWFPDCSNS